MTKEQAVARVAALRSDKQWTARYLAGGNAERQEMRQLNATLAGVPAPTGTPQSIAQARLNALMADKAWGARYLDGGAAERSEMRDLNAIVAAETEE
jgi:hypothetical protein